MKNTIKIMIILLSGCFFISCNKYLDVVPDNIATIDNAFTDRNQAEKFLYTLYSYLPQTGRASVEGRYDDFTWSGRTALIPDTPRPLHLLRDGNRATDPYCDDWVGGLGGTPLWQAIRNCNILLEKIDQVRDLGQYEKIRWIAEAKFLKAYYHFLLLQKYGPIPIVDVNLPVSASGDEVMVERLPVDVVFEYIIEMLDDAITDLPLNIEDETIEMGRITQAAALAVKAKIAVTAASPLFNGNNTRYASFRNSQGQPFFSEYDHGKWAKASEACKQAIDVCLEAGHDLYIYVGTDLSPETQKILQVGRIYTDKWNKEHVWGIAWSIAGNNQLDQYIGAALTANHQNHFRSNINPTMKAVEMFYSQNGVPIEEDQFYDYENRYETVLTRADDNRLLVQTGVQTARLHLNREYRFYGTIAFDGGWWYGLGRTDENDQWPVNTKSGDASGQRGLERHSCTAFYIKKLLNIQSSFSGTTYVPVRSNFPIIRLADLYLLYAEALNEYLDAPNAEVWNYVNLVRERAGLETVQEAWTKYARNPDKYLTQTGMRDIIRRERSIELMFEGHRLFDIRRWNIATSELTGPVRGWNYMESLADNFYQLNTVHNMLFTDRDVLSPIRTSEIAKNPKLVQNPGW